MTKFIYLADSHLGPNPPGYQQQRAYPELLPEIVAALREYVEKEKIDFVLHGGDMIDSTSEESIHDAAKLFGTLNVPVYLCLGNHDLTTPDALQQWLQLAPQFFPNGKPEFSVTNEECIIHVMPNHWGDYAYHWNSDQHMSFDAEQQNFLDAALAINPDRPHLLLTHGPAFGLPREQTGFDKEFHTPNEDFARLMSGLAEEHGHLRCVLGAHNHLNMCIARHETYFVTTSAFVEVPFEFKLFEATRETLSMATVALVDQMNGQFIYNFDKTFVQGRNVDRSF